MVARFDLGRFARDESGATAIEYGLLISLISLALFTIFGNAQTAIVNTINNAMTKIE